MSDGGRLPVVYGSPEAVSRNPVWMVVVGLFGLAVAEPEDAESVVGWHLEGMTEWWRDAYKKRLVRKKIGGTCTYFSF